MRLLIMSVRLYPRLKDSHQGRGRGHDKDKDRGQSQGTEIIPSEKDFFDRMPTLTDAEKFLGIKF
jgi:hypothetical protein